MSDKAFDVGVTHAETNGNLNKWVTSHYFKNPTVNNIRLYGEFAWFFADNKLITVLAIPNDLKSSVQRCQKRRDNDRLDNN